MKVSSIAALAAAGALFGPAVAPAGAATLAVQGNCFVSGQPVPVAGTAFTPGAFVRLAGDAFGRAQVDPAGAFAAQVSAPFVSTIAPKTVRLQATNSANPAEVVAVSFPVVRDLMLTNAPVSGRSRQRTTWRFAGFRPGRPIYAHFRFKGRTMRNYRMGVAAGPCGTLVTRAPRVPVRTLHTGTWTLQVDQRRSYQRSGPRRVIRFRLFRTFG